MGIWMGDKKFGDALGFIGVVFVTPIATLL